MNENFRPMTLHVRVIVPRFVFTARETEDGTLILTADLPGVRDSLKVTIQGRDLTVSTDEIERSFTVGYEYDLDKIETKYEDGVLTVSVPPAPARVITFKEQAPAKVETKDEFDAKIMAWTEDLIKQGALTKAQVEARIKDGSMPPNMLSLVPETKAPAKIEAGIVNPVEMVFETPTPTTT